MKELDMIKAFAELEGFSTPSDNETYKKYLGLWCTICTGNCFGWYNPITNLNLNCAARDKYGVTVEYGFSSSCAIYEADKRGLLRLKSSSTFEHQPVSKAVWIF